MSALGVQEPDLALVAPRNAIPVHVVAVRVTTDTHLVKLLVAVLLRYERGGTTVLGADPSNAVADGRTFEAVRGRDLDVVIAAKVVDGLKEVGVFASAANVETVESLFERGGQRHCSQSQKISNEHVLFCFEKEEKRARGREKVVGVF